MTATSRNPTKKAMCLIAFKTFIDLSGIALSDNPANNDNCDFTFAKLPAKFRPLIDLPEHVIDANHFIELVLRERLCSSGRSVKKTDNQAHADLPM